MMKKYKKVLTAKPGQLRVAWARPDLHNNPDVCYAWGGHGADKSDSHLLHNVFGSERASTNWDTPLNSPRHMWTKYEKSLLDELEARGYDLTTLKFSIERKKDLLK